jgi:hypothetical protein
MFGRNRRDREETSTRGTQDDANLGGYYARDTHRGRYGDDYAREGYEPGRPAPHGDPLLPRESDRREVPSAHGRFRGVGPKGFRRSDDRIREEICERLTEAHEVDASDIDVHVRDGAVLLTGSVTSPRALRFAEQIADECGGVRVVENRLNVGRADREVRIGKAME